jgi:GH24 family phage-related lysozyme (muramidase)
MTTPRGDWQKTVQTDFDDVYYGKVGINDEEVDKLLKHHIKEAVKTLKDVYKNVWDVFRPNEKMAIIVAYFNCNGVVGNNTNFQEHMTGYARTGDKEYLLKAVEELKARSNKDKLPGIAVRREAEAALLNSTECPFYVFGNEKHFPNLRDAVYAEKTRIPSSVTKGELASDADEFFVWRTKLDGKVRESHLIREGLIFRRGRAGMDMPGEAFGCRCWKEALPKRFSVREHKAMFFHLRYSARTCCVSAEY